MVKYYKTMLISNSPTYLYSSIKTRVRMPQIVIFAISLSVSASRQKEPETIIYRLNILTPVQHPIQLLTNEGGYQNNYRMKQWPIVQQKKLLLTFVLISAILIKIRWGTPICPTQRLQKFRHFKAPKIPTLFSARLLNVRQLKIHSFLRKLAFLDDNFFLKKVHKIKVSEQGLFYSMFQFFCTKA